MDKRKILIISLLGLGILGTPVFSQNELTVTNLSVYVIPVLNFTYNGTYGANVFAVSHYTYNDTPYILAVLGSNYPLSVNLFNITGGLVASEDITDLVQSLVYQGYKPGNIFIYEYNNTAYIGISFYQYSISFYSGPYTSLYLYQITINGNNISSPQLVSNTILDGHKEYVYFINTPQNISYIVTNSGIYSINGTILLNISANYYTSHSILPTKNNIYIIYGYYDGNFSLADINLNTGQLYIFYNNTNTLYGLQVFVSTYYPNDYAIAVNTPDWNDIIVNTTMYNLSEAYCGLFSGYLGWIYGNYYGQLSNYPNLSISVLIFNITNNTLYCFPYMYNISNIFVVPNLSIIPSNTVYSIIPIYYNGSDILLFTGGYLFDFNLTNLTVGYTNFTGYCTADNYLISCSGGYNATIYVVSGQPLTPTPTQIYYTAIPETATQAPICYPQQLNYTNFTAYLLHIFNVTFNSSSLSGVNIYSIYPYTYNNNPYILAIVGTVYPQLVSLFNITGGLIVAQNISNLVQDLMNQGYSLGNIFIYEYNDTAYIDISFSKQIPEPSGVFANYLLYQITVDGDNISSPQLVSSISDFDTPHGNFFFAEVANSTIFGGTFFNTPSGQVKTVLNITQGGTTVISVDSGYSYPFNPMPVIFNPVQTIETKDYLYIIFNTGQSTNSNQYLFVFAINKATGQLYTLVNGTQINSVLYPIQFDYDDNTVSIPIVNIIGKYVSILIIGNVSTTLSEYNALVDGNYIIGYNPSAVSSSSSFYTCISMDVFNYTVQGGIILLNLVNQTSLIYNNTHIIYLSEAGYTPIAFSSDDNIYSLLYLVMNHSFISDPSYFQSELYGLYDELVIFLSSGQYSYIQMLPVYNYYFQDMSTGTYVRISQSCSQKGYLIMCTTSNTNISTIETDIYVLSALNLTPTPVDVLLTTPTTPLQYTIPNQTSAPSPSPTSNVTTTAPTTTTTVPTTAPTTSAPSVSVPAGYSTTAQSTVSIPPYSIFVAIIVGAVLVVIYYVRKKHMI